MAEQVKQSPIDLRAYYPLARLRRVIRGYVLVEGVLLALILCCLWFWFSIALDFLLQRYLDIDLLDSAPAVRWVMMAVFAVGISAIVLWYIFRRLFRDFRPASLALVLEKRFPELLGDRLITAVELVNLEQAAKQGYSVEMIVKTMKDAKERVEQVPIHTVFNWRRLILLTWTLVGVSAVVLLLIYPAAVILSLIDMQPSRAVWAMLIVNSMLLLLIVFAFCIPYLLANLREAKSGLRWALLGLGLLAVGGAAAGYYFGLKQVNSLKMHDYSWGLYHAADIGVDRNVLFGNTRWPKDEYFVEWLDFPVAEKRIQFNKTINARAMSTTWIVADNSAPNGWRPMRWSDLPRFVENDQIPELPLDEIKEYLVALTSGDERSPVGFDPSTLNLPSKEEISVDLVAAVVRDKDAPARFGEWYPANAPKFGTMMARLENVAADPKLGGRFIRQVKPPDHMTLSIGNDQSKQRAHSNLAVRDARPHVFSLEQPVALTDKFVVEPEKGQPTTLEKYVPLVATAEIKGKKRQTPVKNVVLVGAPRVQSLVFQEFRPAYYYYLPPAGPRATTIDERRQLLKELRQPLAKMPFTPQSESISLPDFTLDSEIEFTATADKKLREVAVTPRSLDFPGCVSKEDLAPLLLPIQADGRSFKIKFAAKGQPIRDLRAAGTDPEFPLITRPLTFDVTLKDMDNMTSSRSFTVRPIEDKLPTVNLFVDVIRQAKIDDRNVYICTARANIPFAKESVISDENGLHKVEFAYDYSPIVSSAYMPGLSQQMAWVLNNPPVLPNFGDYVYKREALLRNVPPMWELIQRDVPEVIKKVPSVGNVPIAAFENAQGRFAERGVLSVDDLKNRLKNPLPADHSPPVMKKFALKDLDNPLTFDIDRTLPQLREKNAAGLVPNYKLTLDVRATDSNVQADVARSAKSLESLEFRIVSEQELYAYISKEEAELVRRFDELITKLEDQQKVLIGTVQRVPSLSSATSAYEQTRLEGVMDALSNSRVNIAEIYSSYQRIQREYKANRFPDKLTNDLDVKIVDPLRVVQAKEYPQVDKELSQFHVTLKSGRVDLAGPSAAMAQQSFLELLDALRRIRKEMGDSIGFNKIVLKVKAIADGQIALNQDDLKKIELEITRDLLHIRFLPAPEPVLVDAGKTANVKLALRMPKTITLDPVLRFEIPTNSGIKITPSEVKLKDDATQAVFDVTAGQTRGTFFVKIIPTQGDAIDLKIVVK